MERPRDRDFDRSAYRWRPDVDYQAHPEQYRVGKGEQGVLICEPYKGELVPLWRFKTPEVARASRAAIYRMFLKYLKAGDFVGADMARKFLQMGFTRARRYTNYKGGRKYAPEDGRPLAKGTGDPQKAISADLFFESWKRAEANPAYARMKADWKAKFG